jgi:hypothetical protein
MSRVKLDLTFFLRLRLGKMLVSFDKKTTVFLSWQWLFLPYEYFLEYLHSQPPPVTEATHHHAIYLIVKIDNHSKNSS